MKAGHQSLILPANMGLLVPPFIYKWNDLYKKDDDTRASKADLLKMQARIAKLESENDILKKALTIFAKK